MSRTSSILMLLISLLLSLNLWAQKHTGGGGGLPEQEPEDYPGAFEQEQRFIKQVQKQWKNCRLRQSPPKDILSFYQYFNHDHFTLDPNQILHKIFHARRDCRHQTNDHLSQRERSKLACLITKEAKKPLVHLMQNNEIDVYLQNGYQISDEEAQKLKTFYIDLILGD